MKNYKTLLLLKFIYIIKRKMRLLPCLSLFSCCAGQALVNCVTIFKVYISHKIHKVVLIFELFPKEGFVYRLSCS